MSELNVNKASMRGLGGERAVAEASNASGVGHERNAEDARPTVRVRLFAAFREAAGTSELTMPLEPGATVRSVWDALREAHPKLAGWPPSAALNGAWSKPDAPLSAGDEVAYVPPVAGG